MKTIWITLSLMCTVSVTAETETNLCFNGSFDSPKGALDGWNVNYEWMNNVHFMQNHLHVSVLPSFQGRKNVLWVNPPEQARVESKPIFIEKGARYKCTLDLFAPDVRFYFNCYKWEPGVAPHPEPKLSELRRVYKSENFTEGSGGGWKTISFYLPMEEISELAYKHYKDVRYATVYLTRYRGGFHVANVKVVKIPGTYKVVKTTTTPFAPSLNDDEPPHKPMPPKTGPKSGPIDDSNE